MGWAEKMHQTPNELKNNLFLAVNSEGNTATYHTAYTGNKELVQSLLGVNKVKQLNPDDLRKLLVATWHNAAACDYLDLLEGIWLWAGEVQRNPHVFKIIFLLDQYKDGQIVWQVAVA